MKRPIHHRSSWLENQSEPAFFFSSSPPTTRSFSGLQSPLIWSSNPYFAMTPRTDFKLDGKDQELIFKSSDKKHFSLSETRAMENKVWKDMLEIGNDGNMKDQGVITLAARLGNSIQILQDLESKRPVGRRRCSRRDSKSGC